MLRSRFFPILTAVTVAMATAGASPATDKDGGQDARSLAPILELRLSFEGRQLTVRAISGQPVVLMKSAEEDGDLVLIPTYDHEHHAIDTTFGTLGAAETPELGVEAQLETSEMRLDFGQRDILFADGVSLEIEPIRVLFALPLHEPLSGVASKTSLIDGGALFGALCCVTSQGTTTCSCAVSNGGGSCCSPPCCGGSWAY